MDENYNRSLNQIIENSLNLKCLYKFIKDINQEKISNCFETDGSLITVGQQIAKRFCKKFSINLQSKKYPLNQIFIIILNA